MTYKENIRAILECHFTGFKEDIIDSACNRILEQEPKWIPCSERLPEDRELVLLSTVTDDVFEGRFFDDNTDCQWYAFRPDAIVPNHVVTAWMPLPKGYKAEREDNNGM